MQILTWSIINNEIDYLKDIVPYHLSWVDGMYFLDTGSTDGSLEFLREQARLFSNVHVEQYHTKFFPDHSVEWQQMSAPFPEVEVRNFALEQAEKLKFKWLIQLDGDEVFLPETKNVLDLAEQNHKSIITLSTINPVESLSKHPRETRVNAGKLSPHTLNAVQILHDPHARIWQANLKIKFANNPVFGHNQFHCIPVKNGKHVYHAPENLFVESKNGKAYHYHLHWMYGKKFESYQNHRGIADRKQMIVEQKLNAFGAGLPQIFWQRREEWLNYEQQ